MPSIKINEFYGGISQDDEYFGAWQCIFSSWVSHYKDPRVIRPDHTITVVEGNLPAQIVSFMDTWHGAGGWRGEVYAGNNNADLANVTAPASIVYSAPWDLARAWVVFQDYFYFVASNAVYKIALSDIDGDWTGDVTSPISTDGTYNGMVNYLDSNLFVVGAGSSPSSKNIGWTDNTGSWQDVFEEDLSNDIVGITLVSNTLRVYTVETLTIVDIASLTVIDSTHFQYEIIAVESTGLFDYVLVKKSGTATPKRVALFASSGLEFKEVIAPNISQSFDNWQTNVSDYTQTYKFELASDPTASMTFDNDVLYCASQVWSWYTLGKSVLGESFSMLPRTDSSGATIDQVTAIHAFEENVYIWYETTENAVKKYKMGTYNPRHDESDTSRCTDATWISQVLDMWDRSRKKVLQEIRIGKSIDSTTSTLYIRVDWGDWVLLDSLSETDNYHRVICPWYDFYEMELGIKITDADEQISEIEVRYDFVQI